MVLLEPSATVITEQDPLKRIELCGRVCYKSEDKITEDSARKFVEKHLNHGSILEHARVVIPRDSSTIPQLWRFIADPTQEIPYGWSDRVVFTDRSEDVTANVRDLIVAGVPLDEIAKFKISPNFMTVRFVTDRGIWFEINRHRSLSQTVEDEVDIEDQMSYSQESTRYVNYGNNDMAFVFPRPFKWAAYGSALTMDYPEPGRVWEESCAACEKAYKNMLKGGCKPQEARAVLNNSVKTDLIVSGTIEQWDAFLSLRTDKAAHPQMRYLMQLLLQDPNCDKLLVEHYKEKLDVC